MNVICYPSRLQGTLKMPPSKSDAHRKLICAALSENDSFTDFSIISNPDCCEDIEATVRCLEALGARFEASDNGTRIVPISRENLRNFAEIDCHESGSTFRFLLPVAAAICDRTEFRGSGRLPERPISALADAMAQHGVSFSSQMLPFSTSGKLHGGKYEIPGNISSQFLTGLLLALPICSQDSEIHVTTPLESSPYVDLTIQVQAQFGIRISEVTDNGHLVYQIAGNQKYHAPASFSVDGDWSNAAFWLTANALGSDITLEGMQPDSPQGDKLIQTLLRDFHELNTIDVQNIPDLLPILAVRAAYSERQTQFINAERLRYKESDRLSTTADLIRQIGAKAHVNLDSLTIQGGNLRGGLVNANNDHRLAMSAAIAALQCNQAIEIQGAECVKKSYPRFFEHYVQLGGKCDGIHLR